MSVILVFLLVVLGFGGWWLAQQRLMSKPWLEIGPGPAAVAGPPTEKIALAVFLAVLGALFALFASAYVMRMELADWRPAPMPRILWMNTAMLVLASACLQAARSGARRRDLGLVRLGLATGGGASLAFLIGQLAAWRELAEAGRVLASGPSDSFFYLLTGLHGLHVLGGLVALGAAAVEAWGARPERRLGLRVELCAMYWHFLLVVWIGLLVLLLGWAKGLIDLCRAALT